MSRFSSTASKHRTGVFHAFLSLAAVLLYLLLTRPEVIVIPKLGFTVWYPATGMMLAVMLRISPWYFLLNAFAGTLAGALSYHQSLHSWSSTVGSVVGSGCYGLAAYLLRGPLKI